MPPTTADKAADKAATAQALEDAKVAEATKSGADLGARAVADAVAKVANAAVAEIQKTVTHVTPELVLAVGHNVLHIRGTGFRASGSVLLNGSALQVISWGGEQIEARLPADAKSGELTVWIDPETQKKGYLKLP